MSSAETCPVTGAAPPREESSSEPRCPFGYGGSSGPRIGELSCVICRSILFDAVKTSPCSHVFCEACVARFQDCPVCGQDVSGVEPAGELRGLVDAFIGALGSRIEQAPGTAEEDGDGGKLTPAEFLQKVAHNAIVGGNIDSGVFRLRLCRDKLSSLLEASSGDRQDDVFVQLGTVMGSIGDALRHKGDHLAAREHYEACIHRLQGAGEGRELASVLSVTHNKLGDLSYRAEDLKGARSHYVAALEARRAAVAAEAPSPPGSLLLDVAVSLAKVGDVDVALGDKDGGGRLFQEALELVESLGDGPLKDEAAEGRRQSVLHFLRQPR